MPTENPLVPPSYAGQWRMVVMLDSGPQRVPGVVMGPDKMPSSKGFNPKLTMTKRKSAEELPLNRKKLIKKIKEEPIGKCGIIVTFYVLNYFEET